MLLLVGLGNPGAEYARSRHNLGFMVADRIAGRLSGSPSFREKFSGEMVKGTLGNQEVVVLKPLTYMNLSGRSVQRAAAFFQIPVQDIVVIYDELDLPWRTIRMKIGGGAGGHNGIKSVTEQLGSPDYVRIRIGIGKPTHGPGKDYVLSGFNQMENAELDDVLERAARAVETLIARGLERAMNEVNTKDKEARQ